MRTITSDEKRPPLIANALQQLVTGRGNNCFSITLDANAATTTVSGKLGIATGDAIFLSPQTANAAAALATTYAIASATNTVTIHHANNAQTDKTFWLMFKEVV